MRLLKEEIDIIKSAITRLDPSARIYLFGSRVNDQMRGGDIDLLILSEHLTQRDARSIRMAIFEKMEEQKIDILIAQNDTDPFVKIALKTGVLL